MQHDGPISCCCDDKVSRTLMEVSYKIDSKPRHARNPISFTLTETHWDKSGIRQFCGVVRVSRLIVFKRQAVWAKVYFVRSRVERKLEQRPLACWRSSHFVTAVPLQAEMAEDKVCKSADFSD